MGRRPKQEAPKHVAEAQPMDGMRSMWEFVFISQFLRVFQDKFGFAHFELEDLENAFLEAENYPLFSIFASLLRIHLKRHDIRMDSWQDVLSEELEKRDANWNPIKDSKYSEISVEERILLLQHLIDYVCENDQNPELKKFRADFLNPDSKNKGLIGRDSQGNIYWYFDDLRLYKEKKTKKGNKKSWETLCTSSEEWDTFIKSFEKSKDSNEKKLYQYLHDELYPTLVPLLKEHEKEKELKSKKRKVKSPKSKQKELSREEEKDVLIKREEDEIKKMKQEEESEKQTHTEIEHRKKGRRRKADIERDNASPDQDETSHQMNEQQEELEKRVAEELEKQNKMISAEDIESGLVPRTKRRCVIVREQTKKKKEWWEEEGIGSDLDEPEEDIDSDSSDGPKRKKKRKIIKPMEIPGATNRTYVFSTALANRAAEAVQQGRVESIIAFHRAQQTTSPYLKLEKERTFESSNKSYEQQKAYYSQQYRQQPGMGSMMPRGYGGVLSSLLPDGTAAPGGRQGYGPAQWQQLQLQQQYNKDRQQQQPYNQVVDDLSQIIFGGPSNGNAQTAVGDPAYHRGAYTQRMGMTGQQGIQFGYPQRMPAQQQQSFQDQYRPPFQQNQFPGYAQQQQQQQQAQFFQRPRHLPQLHSPGAQSPSDPLGANVRSPPPPYPGNRTGDSRTQQQQHHLGNSPAPVPSPTSTGSPQTPLTPHTPHTPRFSGAVASPGEPSKPPFSPSGQHSPYAGTVVFSTKRPSSESSGSETTSEGQNRPGYIDLGKKNYPTAPGNSHRPQNPYSSFGHSSPMENNQENALRSPSDVQTQRSMTSFDNQPNESPFLTSASQQNINRSPFATTAASVSKSFSVESLTAPSQPANRTGHPLGADQQMPPYGGGIYYQSKYQAPGMFGGQRYPYPSEALYNSPALQTNMYIDRGSMSVYPPGRDSHL